MRLFQLISIKLHPKFLASAKEEAKKIYKLQQKLKKIKLSAILERRLQNLLETRKL